MPGLGQGSGPGSDGLVCHEQGEGEEYKYNLCCFYNPLLQYSNTPCMWHESIATKTYMI
jgi:hypothetical protein